MTPLLPQPPWNLEFGPLRRPLLHDLHVGERAIKSEELETRHSRFILIPDRPLVWHAPHPIVIAQPFEECLIPAACAQRLS